MAHKLGSELVDLHEGYVLANTDVTAIPKGREEPVHFFD
jgi:hypothetical protein